MRHRQISAVVAAVLAAGLIRPVVAPAATSTYEVSDPVNYIIETDHGQIFLEAIHPLKDGKIVTGPTILTYSPYSILGRNGDAGNWVPRGYTRIYADVVGTGNSGGCWDYGGIREKETGYDVVEWIAKQKWSTGKVGMIGASYEGTTATATAVMNPPHLTTIVPEAAIVRWYDYAYAGGIRYNLTNEFLGHEGPGAITDEGLDTPLAFDFGLAIPPPLDPQDPNWADRVASTITPCDEVTHTMYGYDVDTPDYDKFWEERDYSLDAKNIDIPVLVAHNWGDWNVKQSNGWDLYQAIKNTTTAKMYFGTRWEGHGTPGGEYGATVNAWMDHYLMGVDNNIEKLADVTSQTSDSEGPGEFISGTPKTTNVPLIAQEVPRTNPDVYQWQLLPTKPSTFGFQAPSPATFPSTNVNTESHAAHHSRQNHDWIWFESPPLKKDTRIFGEIKLQIWSHAARQWITWTPSVFDADPADHEYVQGQHVNKDPKALVAVTRGWLDSRYRNSLYKQTEITPGRSFGMTIPMKPQDYTFKKGHFIGLNFQTEIGEWSIPKPYPGCEGTPDQSCANVYIDWTDAKTRLILPIVNAPKNVADLFVSGGHHH